MTELEYLGFLKIDLLGLKNLTLIDRAVVMIQQNHNRAIDIDMLPLDDHQTFQLLCAGKTSGVFQLESEGLKEVLRKLQPEKFEDIIAVNALYRPGPLGSGMVDDFIERKHGRQKITYLFKELEPILEETYGVIVYQEQVMKIASAIAGYSLGQSDILRRAMGKKKQEEMTKQRELFLNGARERNFDAQKAGELFDLMAYFAGYGFNKSHSAAYGLIAYQTAYLKAHYPAEFMACLISLEVTNADKMVFYLQEAKDMELDIIPPDINRSHINFTVSEGKIVFGLHGIKSVGLASLENICAERSKKPFLDLLDFCTRIDLRTSNKRVIEHLIYAGAFDTLPGHRAQQYAELSRIIEQAAEQKLAAQTGQLGLFAKKTNTAEPEPYAFQPLEPWTNKEQLEKEQEVIGFYLSAHPLQTYRHQISLLSPTPCADIIKIMQTYNSQQEPLALVCGLLKSKKDIITKKGDRMAFLQLEDESGVAEIILFPNTFKKVERWLTDAHHVFVAKGIVDLTSPQKCKIKAEECIPIEQVLQEWSSIAKVSFMLPPLFTQETLNVLDEYLIAGKSVMELIFHENGKQISIVANRKITVDEEMVNEIYKKNIGVKIWL
jgi:DNA polymerase-3 subunit alpha